MTKYKKLKLKDGTTMDEHRYLMEQKIGRKLKRYEVVHHINGNGRDNREENLELKILSEHSRQHRIGKKSTLKTKQKLSIINSGSKNPNAKLTKNIVLLIKQLLNKNISCAAIGRIYNVHRCNILRIKQNKAWQCI